MRIFDLHSDIIHYIKKRDISVESNFEFMEVGNKVCYAIFIPEEQKKSEEYINELIDIKKKIISLNELSIFSIENIPGIAYLGNEELMQGVKYISLCHNLTNEFCDSSTDQHQTHEGISAKGKRIIRIANKEEIMIDISHASDKAASDIILFSELPVLASHSNCYSIHQNPRNLNDELIDQIALSHGIIGVTLLPKCLGSSNPVVIRDHIFYLEHRIGEQFIGIGTDFFGGGIRIPYRGISSIINNENILYNNARRLLE